MKQFPFPSFVELSILGTLALLCAAILAHLDTGALGVLCFPLLLVGMFMGAWRSGKLHSTSRQVAGLEEPDEIEV